MKTNEHKPILYTEADSGCHIDGAYGIDHARQKLIDMLEYVLCAYSPGVDPRPRIEEIQTYLEQEGPLLYYPAASLVGVRAPTTEAGKW